MSGLNVWVQIHDLPVAQRTKKVAGIVGATLGHYQSVDRYSIRRLINAIRTQIVHDSSTLV